MQPCSAYLCSCGRPLPPRIHLHKSRRCRFWSWCTRSGSAARDRLTGALWEERDRKSWRSRGKTCKLLFDFTPLKALPSHQYEGVPARTDSCEPEAGINSTPCGWNQRGAPRREKAMKWEEIPNYFVGNSAREEKGFGAGTGESF